MQPCEWYLGLARLMVTALLSIAGVCNATPIQWRVTQGGNGHYYDLVHATGLSWLQARDIAAGTFFLGSRGHLATVTSSVEDTFLRVNLGNQVVDAAASNIGLPVVPGVYAWIGLTDETYRSVTGEPFPFANWAARRT